MTQTSPPERYTILRELGRGAIGTVYAARDGSTGAVVALKILDPALFSEANEPLAEAFLNNARSAAGLRHRNIVRVFDAGEAGGTAYVAMELVEGESLRRVLDHGPLSIARAVQIFDDIASALAYAHEERMVHRGLKPSNIIVAPSGVAKIGDFGTGQIGEAALRYMSPEQVRRDPVDARSDLFSLGAVFYEMLTRRAPFEGDSPEQIKQNILRAAPPPPSTSNPHVPGALDAIVARLLAPRPDDRFANARDLAARPAAPGGRARASTRRERRHRRTDAKRAANPGSSGGLSRRTIGCRRLPAAHRNAGWRGVPRARREVHGAPRTAARTVLWIAHCIVPGGTRACASRAFCWTHRAVALLA